MRVLGINALFHDSSAALVVDGRVVSAAEEERFTRRKHAHEPVPFAAWEVPAEAAAWCIAQAGLTAADLDVVGYSYDPALAAIPARDVRADTWEGMRTLYAEEAPNFLSAALPGLDPSKVVFVPHHLAHAGSAALAAPHPRSSVLVMDGRGENASHLAGTFREGRIETLASQRLPHSLGLTYESLTQHLGFRRASDEYKVMALAAYGTPRHLGVFRERIRALDDGGFMAEPLDWSLFAPAVSRGEAWTQDHADLAASMQVRLEEVVLDLARWLHSRSGDRVLTMAGGVALNCVANGRLAAEGPFEEVWIQPAAGDSGTALGAALLLASESDHVEPMPSPALGRSWSDEQLGAVLREARVPFHRPDDIAEACADVLSANGIVAWFQGRSEFGPRALGHRSLLANPSDASNLHRLNDIKGREQFRPVAPMVLESRAAEIFVGPVPSPYMLFTHSVRPEWRARIAAALHVDGSARAQTVAAATEPLVARLLEAFAARTGVPVLINTSLNTAGRPMVDSPRDALECFGSSPIDALALGPFLVCRGEGSVSRWLTSTSSFPRWVGRACSLCSTP